MLRVPAVCSLLALRSGCSWDCAGPLGFFGVPLLPAFLESGDWGSGGCACWGFCGGSLPASQQQRVIIEGHTNLLRITSRGSAAVWVLE